MEEPEPERKSQQPAPEQEPQAEPEVKSSVQTQTAESDKSTKSSDNSNDLNHNSLSEFFDSASGVFKKLGKDFQSRDLSKSGFGAAQIAGDFIDFAGSMSEKAAKTIKEVEKRENERGGVKSDASDGAKRDKNLDKTSREELTGLAKDLLKDDDRLKPFLDNVETFEKRAKEEKLSTEEKERFYSQVKDVLEASKTGNKNFDGDYLKTIATDMVKAAANPGGVNQGSYGTCTAAALQSALFKAEPATIGGLVRDMALNGEYKTVDNSTITPNEMNLKADKFHGKTPHDRSTVDQLAQIALLNIFWQRQEGLHGHEPEMKGKIKYEEGHVRDHINDDRTRLMDYSESKPKPFTESAEYIDPGYKNDQQQAHFQNLEQRPIGGPRITDMENIAEMYSQIRGNHGNLKVISAEGGKSVFKPKSQEELSDFIEKAKKENNGVMPAVVLGVHTDVEPFKTDIRDAFESQKGKDPEEAAIHAHHAVALFDSNQEKQTALVENQWGDKVDHTNKPGSKAAVAMKDLFRAIKGRDATEIESDRAKQEEREQKKQPENPEEVARTWINEQEKLVKEMEGGTGVDQKRLLEQEMKLFDYYKSWGRDGEAAKQLDKSAEIFSKTLKSNPLNFNMEEGIQTFSNLSSDLKKEGNREAQIKELGDLIERRVTESLNNLPQLNRADFSEIRQALKGPIQAISVFDSAGNSASAQKVADKLAQVVEAGRLRNGAADRTAVFLATEVSGALVGAKRDDDAEKVLNSAVSDLRKVKPVSEKEQNEYTKGSIELAHEAENLENKSLYTSLYSELESTFEKMKESGVALDNSSRTELRYDLMNHYADTKNAEKMDPIVKEYIASAEKRRADLAATPGRQPAMDYIFEKSAEMMMSVRQPEKALEYYKKAMESLKDKDDVVMEGQDIAARMIPLCLKLNKEAEAKALATQYQLEGLLKRRGP